MLRDRILSLKCTIRPCSIFTYLKRTCSKNEANKLIGFSSYYSTEIINYCLFHNISKNEKLSCLQHCNSDTTASNGNTPEAVSWPIFLPLHGICKEFIIPLFDCILCYLKGAVTVTYKSYDTFILLWSFMISIAGSQEYKTIISYMFEMLSISNVSIQLFYYLKKDWR